MAQQKIHFAILQYLQDFKSTEGVSEDDAEGIDVALQCLSSAWKLNLNDTAQQQQHSIAPLNLTQVFAAGIVGSQAFTEAAKKHLNQQPQQAPPHDEGFQTLLNKLSAANYFKDIAPGSDEYARRVEKAREKYNAQLAAQRTATHTAAASSAPAAATTATTATATATPAPTVEATPTADQMQQAEQLKVDGNAHMAANRLDDAVDCYTRAIALNPTNAIYYCNRAAVFSHRGSNVHAENDCREAIKRNPSYSKAHSRLGFALFAQGKYKEAIEAYEQAVKLEPTNASFNDALRSAKQRLAAEQPAASQAAAPSGMPDLSALQGMLGGLGGGMGGMDMSQLASMAQSFMSNPQFASMAQGLMSSLGGGQGGEAPDIQALLSAISSEGFAWEAVTRDNPELADMVAQLEGGANPMSMLGDPRLPALIRAASRYASTLQQQQGTPQGYYS
eukprot:TRINITY_DN15079_c0_g1_i1.p1 TRINITY_DN15079_c0_g1~~TRINITY_DN15079_c0_g1_i1.p1  ORF type:complete len:458 (+),score=132.13 TRINITY_DN15079_c0_g1_i1:35-1375(+)